MPRRKLDLKLVSCESARKVTFRKRKQGLVKKMGEITTLCGINGCIIIYNPKENEPHIWPSKEKAAEMMAKYESMPKIKQETKKVDQEKFMQHRVDMLREQREKRKKKNMEIQASLIIYQLTQEKTMEDLAIAEIDLLLWFSKIKLKEINRRNILLPPIGLSSKLLAPSQISPPPPPPPPALHPPQSFPMEPPSYHIKNDPFYKNMFGLHQV